MSNINSNGMHFISRVHREHNESWLVRVAMEYNFGKQKRFGDFTYGSKAKSLKAAKRWRDKKVKLIQEYYQDVELFKPIKYWLETVTTSKTWRNGFLYEYQIPTIIAYINKVGGKNANVRKSWSINKWGKAEAIKLAEAWVKEHNHK